MRRLASFALALVTFAAGCQETPPPNVPGPTTAKPPAATDATGPHKGQVRTIAQRDGAAKVVAIRVVFNVGSADDPTGKEGLHALTAAMIAQSGTEKLTFGELSKKLYPFAASVDAHVDRDQITFSTEVAAESLDAFYPIFRDVLLTPRLDKESFDRLKARATSGLVDELKGANDEELGKEALAAMLYAGHPYGHPAVGTETGLAAITLDDVTAAKKSAFCKDRVVVGVAGGFPEGFEVGLGRDLAQLPACAGPRAALPVPKKTAGTKIVIVDKPSADSTAISIGFPTELDRASDDFPAVAFFTASLGLHRQSAGVLYNRLRELRGFNYGDYMYPEYFEQEGWGRFPLPNIVRRQQMISIWLRPIKPENALFALRGALYYYRQRLETGIPDEEIGRFRGFLSRYIGLEQQTPARRLGFAMDDAAYGLAVPHVERMRTAWSGLTSAKLKDVVGKRFTKDDLTIVLVAKNGAAVKAAIVKGDKTPPKYDAPKPKEVTDEDRIIEALPFGVKDADVTVVPIATLFH
jgi:zinc protease